MKSPFDPASNYRQTRQRTGYVERLRAGREIYRALGFKSGLEIHQQLRTSKKLFCRCPARKYRPGHDFDAELIRHMRPTLSELGEYDGTALMEFKTKKNIVYRIKDESACTYDIDDTPPFPIDREALNIAIEIAVLLETNIVGELHITRKQYLDGSIPTGFQRTAIVGVSGRIPITGKEVGIIQISVEEDSCREVADVGHLRTYTTDRLGIPLIETVTAPDMHTPDEVAEAGQYLRYLARSTGKVRTGIGAARQDVNVSVAGGTRVEIKGVAHIRRIPELTHNEAFRQKALLDIADLLKGRVPDPLDWDLALARIYPHHLTNVPSELKVFWEKGYRMVALNLPLFKGFLSYFTQPGKMFADELSDRLKVIACIEKPNMSHSEAFSLNANQVVLNEAVWSDLRRVLKAGDNDAQVIVWGPAEDIDTAVDTIRERCRIAITGVPNETRKSSPDGTTVFERVLPGPDRMYPDTDSAPIPIEDEYIESIRADMPPSVEFRRRQLREWKVPDDAHDYLLRRNLVWLIEKITAEFDVPPTYVGRFFGHRLRHLEYRVTPVAEFDYNSLYGLFKFIHKAGLHYEVAGAMLPELYAHPKMVFDSILNVVGYRPCSREDILSHIPNLNRKFDDIGRSPTARARIDWIMGHLRTIALGNAALGDIARAVAVEVNHE